MSQAHERERSRNLDRKQDIRLRFVERENGRRIAVESRGNPDGLPVVLLHGAYGSRIPYIPQSRIPEGIHLITYDRPGYGDSDRQEGRTMSDTPLDVKAIMDNLGIEKSIVIGFSAGPHALACAALLPERVEKVFVIAGLAPPNAKGLDWYKGMDQINVNLFSDAARGGEGHTQLRRHFKQHAQEKPEEQFTNGLLSNFLTDADREILNDPEIRELAIASRILALQQGIDGWFDDDIAQQYLPWGFDPADITVPVFLYHGTDDRIVPPSHSEWLAKQIPNATLTLYPGQSHYLSRRLVPQILEQLVESKNL